MESCDLKKAKKMYPPTLIQNISDENLPHESPFAKTLLQELRMRYLMELEGAYYTHFEEGLLYPESFVVLKNSIDRSMDTTEKCISDWEFIKDLIHNDFWIRNGHKFRGLGCIYNMVRRLVFHRLKIVYDVIQNYVTCSHYAKELLEQFINEQGGQTIESYEVIHEIENNIERAYVRLNFNIRSAYPYLVHKADEIAARHFILNTLHKHYEDLGKKGQLDKKHVELIEQEIHKMTR